MGVRLDQAFMEKTRKCFVAFWTADTVFYKVDSICVTCLTILLLLYLLKLYQKIKFKETGNLFHYQPFHSGPLIERWREKKTKILFSPLIINGLPCPSTFNFDLKCQSQKLNHDDKCCFSSGISTFSIFAVAKATLEIALSIC